MTVRLTGVGLTHANGRRALQEVDLTVNRGERLAIIGPSGAGKTTLLRLLATSLQPSEGRLELLGSEPWSLPAGQRKRLRARLGLVHQSPPLPPRQRVVTAVLAGRLGQWPLWK
ncbi:MAG: ATP-binding cassette domain-containing protein, partial [Pseudomonas sp.]|nr:ATP-binding cassette domain-containing protein [Pseudomonas sp.]